METLYILVLTISLPVNSGAQAVVTVVPTPMTKVVCLNAGSAWSAARMGWYNERREALCLPITEGKK